MNSIPAMNRRERFLAAVDGRAVDRPPVVAWVHFLSDHLPGDETARLHLEFLRAYDWDVAKLMNDYRYPVPPGLELLDSAEAMRRFRPLSLDERSFAEQLRAIERLRREHAPPCRTESAVFARRVDSTLNWTPEIEAMTEGRA